MKARFENIIVNLVFSFCFTLLTFTIYFNPSGAEPYSPFTNIIKPFIISIILSGGFYFFLQYLTYLKRVKYFLINLIIQALLILTSIIYLGINLHRDYFSLTFQILTIYYTVFLTNLTIFKPNAHFYKSVNIFTTIVVVAIFSWILLMGYSIVKREEPRWAEATIYNIYYLVILIILYYKNYKLSYYTKKHIIVKDARIFIDDFDLSQIIGADHINILNFFINKKKGNCYLINKYLSEFSNKNIPCSEFCDNKPHICNYYRNLYNKINNLKRFLELLHVGTIKPCENKRDIKNEGWSVEFYKDTEIKFE